MNGVEAREGHMTLLTVGEADERRIGGTADLYLEIKPGSGRVFIDSFPLTQLDTQITTRYSRDVACNFLDIDCSNKDFFYTIRAGTSLIGGPSAGAGKTILTIALLDNERIKSDVLITGTINSGGIIGPVSGIGEKAKAAEDLGFKVLLIPKWSSNNTDALEDFNYGEFYGVEDLEIVPVSTVEEALNFFVEKDYTREHKELEIPSDYLDIMSFISSDLCDRTKFLLGEASNDSESYSIASDNYLLAQNVSANENYYSSASYCFGANVILRNILYENLSSEEIDSLRNVLFVELNEFSEFINNYDLETISDLETSIIVKERLLEAARVLEQETNTIGYAEERLYSAYAWSNFFNYEGEEVNLEDSFLRNACLTKISEVEERVNYVDFLFGSGSVDESYINELRNIFSTRDYPFCIFRATNIKADINSLILSSTIPSDLREAVAKDKVSIAKQQISFRESFPIIGFSYYTYAEALVESDPRSSIIFSEYAIEFSNLDMYFSKGDLRNDLYFDYVFMDARFFLGFSLGALFIVLLSLTSRNLLFKPRKISRRNPPGKKR